MINSYNQISLKLYRELKEISEDTSKGETLRSAEVIAILSGKSLDEILQMPISDFQDLVASTSFLTDSPDFSLAKVAPKKLKIDNQDYDIQLDIYKWSTSQFMDFQEFIKTGNTPNSETFSNVLACIVIPKNKAYGIGYDPLDVAKLIDTSIDIQTACKIFFYFLRRYRGSTEIILKYSDMILKSYPKIDLMKL